MAIQRTGLPPSVPNPANTPSVAENRPQAPVPALTPRAPLAENIPVAPPRAAEAVREMGLTGRVEIPPRTLEMLKDIAREFEAAEASRSGRGEVDVEVREVPAGSVVDGAREGAVDFGAILGADRDSHADGCDLLAALGAVGSRVQGELRVVPRPTTVVDIVRRGGTGALPEAARRELQNLLGSIDPNALVQWVLREAYLENTEDLRFYAEKVKFFNDVKKALREEAARAREALQAVAGGKAEDLLPEPFVPRDIETEFTGSDAQRQLLAERQALQEAAGDDATAAATTTEPAPAPPPEAAPVEPVVAAPPPVPQNVEQSDLVIQYNGDGQTQECLKGFVDDYKKRLDDMLATMPAEQKAALWEAIKRDNGIRTMGQAQERAHNLWGQRTGSVPVIATGVDTKPRPGETLEGYLHRIADETGAGMKRGFDAMDHGFHRGLGEEKVKVEAIDIQFFFPRYEYTPAAATPSPSAPVAAAPGEAPAAAPVTEPAGTIENHYDGEGGNADVMDDFVSRFQQKVRDMLRLPPEQRRALFEEIERRGGVSLTATAQERTHDLVGQRTGTVELTGEADMAMRPGESVETYLERIIDEAGGSLETQLKNLHQGHTEGGVKVEDVHFAIELPPYTYVARAEGSELRDSGPGMIDTKGQLDDYIKSLEEKLSSVGDDAQLANVDLQNVLQKQQQNLQMISNISKMLHDTASGIIRKIGG